MPKIESLESELDLLEGEPGSDAKKTDPDFKGKVTTMSQLLTKRRETVKAEEKKKAEQQAKEAKQNEEKDFEAEYAFVPKPHFDWDNLGGEISI